ncbi:MAG: 5,10-methylenetetrahydrofolate reductase, partial [Chloroflexi bacterium]|nr:5,10-methylenetetrahydrofolate reductase [Chloroflexota bacterium]
EKDCAWALIYERLKGQGRLELMRKYQPPRNYQAVPRPRMVKIQ